MAQSIKCKLCNEIMFYGEGREVCPCGNLEMDGIQKRIICKRDQDWCEVDDEGHEIIDNPQASPNRKDLMDMLRHMITSIESLPIHAMNAPINHFDFVSMLLLIERILLEPQEQREIDP